MKVGKGIFQREESWQCYSAKVGGYIYHIQDTKNFDPVRGWKIMSRDGGNDYVYYLAKVKDFYERLLGEKAYKLFEKIAKDRRSRNSKYRSMGDHTYVLPEGNDTKMFAFSLAHLPEGKPWEYDEGKTIAVIAYREEQVSEYFSTFRECLSFAEKYIDDQTGQTSLFD